MSLVLQSIHPLLDPSLWNPPTTGARRWAGAVNLRLHGLKATMLAFRIFVKGGNARMTEAPFVISITWKVGLST